MPAPDRFTDPARQVLNRAQVEAAEMGHALIDSEHLLLALLHDLESHLAGRVLLSLGVPADRLRRALDYAMAKFEAKAVDSVDSLTNRSQRVLELSLKEASECGRSEVDTDHILLALIDESGGLAAGVLESVGLTAERVREEAKRISEGGEILVPAGGGEQEKPAHKAKTATPTLDAYALDLTALAAADQLDPMVGRERELERVVHILSRRTKNNPVLVGDAGVGKTAIAEGLAQLIVSAQAPEPLRNHRVLSLNLGMLVAGTKYRGEFEQRLKDLLAELTSGSERAVLFIDELHTLVGAGSAGGSLDASNMLKPALARGQIQVLGATTAREYRKYIEKDAALERRFQPLKVNEPSADETVRILTALKPYYEQHHGVTISDEASVAAVELSLRYIHDRKLPDKAIDLIDESASRVAMKLNRPTPELKAARAKLNELQAARPEAGDVVTEQLRTEQINATTSRIAQEQARIDHHRQGNSLVTAADIAEVVSMWTGIPAAAAIGTEAQRLLNMESFLRQRIVGQAEAVSALSRAVRRARAGLKSPKRPVGSWIFLGPTGVGKTEVAKALAEFLFGSEDALIRFDMSEYMERHEVSRLIGAAPGYVGYEEGGQLTKAVKRRPYCVLLFDEIEKAHPDVFNILLQLLEDGVLTDSSGEQVSFANTIVVMTSNLGSEALLSKGRAIGFGNAASDDQTNEKVMKVVKATFTPEFLNRIDGTIIFRSLEKEELRQIVERQLVRVIENLQARGVELLVTDEAKDWLIGVGYDRDYGARPLRRAIQQHVEDGLSEGLLRGSYPAGTKLRVDHDDTGLVFSSSD